MTVEEKRNAIKNWCLYEYEGECIDCPLYPITTGENANCYTGVSDDTLALHYKILVASGLFDPTKQEECE